MNEANDSCSLKCLSGHTLCGECSVSFVDSILAGGPSCVPPKCSICRGLLPLKAFERILTTAQMNLYLSYVAMSKLEKGEEVVSCVQCSYHEIRTDKPPIFYCRHPACRSIHCCNCKRVLEMPDEDLAPTDAEFEAQQMKIAKHFECAELAEEKAKFDQALEEGNGVRCPGCGARGRKDSQCCHMYCAGCGVEYCYVRERAEQRFLGHRDRPGGEHAALRAAGACVEKAQRGLRGWREPPQRSASL